MHAVIKLPKLSHRQPINSPDATSETAAERGVIAGLLRDKRGSMFVFMAVSMLALATATGVGVDFARGLNFKSDLQGAVDAAAIAGASVYLNAGYSSQANTAATNYMTKATVNLPTNNGVTSSISVSQSAPWTVTDSH